MDSRSHMTAINPLADSIVGTGPTALRWVASRQGRARFAGWHRRHYGGQLPTAKNRGRILFLNKHRSLKWPWGSI